MNTELLVHRIVGSHGRCSPSKRTCGSPLCARATGPRAWLYKRRRTQRLANETMTQAEELERRTRSVTPPAAMPQQVGNSSSNRSPRRSDNRVITQKVVGTIPYISLDMEPLTGAPSQGANGRPAMPHTPATMILATTMAMSRQRSDRSLSGVKRTSSSARRTKDRPLPVRWDVRAQSRFSRGGGQLGSGTLASLFRATTPLFSRPKFPVRFRRETPRKT